MPLEYDILKKSENRNGETKINGQKTVYVVFSKTGTGIGKMICTLTHTYYNHVSLAFDGNLRAMYSFGRRHVNSPLVGGFIVERPARYLANGGDIDVKICRVELTEEEYIRIRKLILHFYKRRNDILYNTFAAICSVIGRRGNIHDTYTCIGFVTYALGISGALTIPELELLLKGGTIYSGSLRSVTKGGDRAPDSYFIRQSKWQIYWGTTTHFSRLIGRACGDTWKKVRAAVGR